MRYGGLSDFFNCIEYKSPYAVISDLFLGEKINKHLVITNKTLFQPYRDKLIDVCKKFVK